MIELVEQHEAVAAGAVVRQRHFEHRAPARDRREQRLVGVELERDRLTLGGERRCAREADIGVRESDAAVSRRIRVILHQAAERRTRGVGLIDAVGAPLDVEVAGRGRFVVVAIGIGNDGVADLAVVIAGRQTGQPVLIHDGRRHDRDVGQIGAMIPLVGQTRDGGMAKTDFAEGDLIVGGKTARRDNIRIRRHRAGRIDRADDRVAPQHFKLRGRRERRARLELDGVGLTGGQPAQLLRDLDVAGRSAHVDHVAMGRRVHIEIAVDNALGLHRPCRIDRRAGDGPAGEIAGRGNTAPGLRRERALAEVAIGDQVGRRRHQDRHVVVDGDGERARGVVTVLVGDGVGQVDVNVVFVGRLRARDTWIVVTGVIDLAQHRESVGAGSRIGDLDLKGGRRNRVSEVARQLRRIERAAGGIPVVMQRNAGRLDRHAAGVENRRAIQRGKADRSRLVRPDLELQRAR
ncbi:hypothetical protein ES707_04264 [subsurface metagenome]